MRISDAVATLEREVERLKRREIELMDRCGVLLERSRTVTGTTSDLFEMPPWLADLIIAADNVLVDESLVARGELADAIRKAPHGWMTSFRTAYAESLHRDPEEKAGPA